MDETPGPDRATLGLDDARRIDDVCNRFEAAWKAGCRPRIEDHLAGAAGPEGTALLRELVPIDIFHRRRRGEAPRPDDYRGRFPALDDGWLNGLLAAPGANGGAAPPADLVAAIGRYDLLPPAQLAELPALRQRFADDRALAGELIRRGALTHYQADRLLRGRGDGLRLGAYVLLKRLGKGGMGTVYKARHARLGRTVALKVIRREHLLSPEAVWRFRREVRAAAALSHPNVVHAYDADETNGTHYFAMEYAGGTDLARLVARKGRLPVRLACACARQAALGLQHAFERGMVHRDVKPSNLLLTPAGTVKLLDLGLAQLGSAEGESVSQLTLTGAVIGTPDYTAPEQTEESHGVDIRADLYSLGCTLYHLLTGRAPFPSGTHVQKASQHRSAEPEPVEALRPEVPAAVAAVVRKLMAKAPADRYQTPAEAVAALDAAANPRPVVAPPVGPPADDRPVAALGDIGALAAPPDPGPRRTSRGIVNLASTVPFAAARALLGWWVRPPAAGDSAPQPAAEARPDPSRAEALAALRELGARVEFDEKQPGKLVVGVDLTGRVISDDELVCLRHFPEMRCLHLSETPVSDAGLAHLLALTDLADLHLSGTRVGDRGLQYLAHLKNLNTLSVDGTKVTDAGLEHLASLKAMKELLLANTTVGDAGLRRLESLPALGVLGLSGTQVTPEGLSRFRAAQPGVDVRR